MRLLERIFELESFQKEFSLLLKVSVADLFPVLEKGEQDLFSEVDWPYLLTCASALSHSGDAKHQDAALRIAQCCLVSNRASKIQKLGASVILHKLTNKPALDLAVEKDYLPADFLSHIPMPLQIEQARRDIDHIVFTENNKEVYLNRFQRLFYKKSNEVDHISASAPTSAGKSFILNLLVLDYLTARRPINIVYLVPTRALISQVERDLSKELIENNVKGVYLSSVPQIPESNSDAVLFVFTQERLHWLLNNHPDFKVDVLVVDEAQKIGDGSRGVLLQQKIEELVSLYPNLRIFFCSASTENPQILLTGLGSNASTQAIAIDYVAVNQNLIWVSKAPHKPKEWSVDLCLSDDRMPLGKISVKKALSEKAKLPTFAYLMGSEDGGTMIYVNGQKEAEDAASHLYDLVGEEGEIKDNEIESLIELTAKIVHKDYILNKVLKRGIAFHYGNMPLVVKNEIEELFSNGKIKYLICTSTLLEGVNLPARSIFIRNPKRGNRHPMSEDDFWNLAGRAGRLKREFQGNIICIDPSEWNPPTKKKKYAITRAITEISKDKEDLLNYIQKDTPRSEIKGEFEYALSYYFTRFLKTGSLSDLGLDADFAKALEDECLRIKAEIEVPDEIIYRNPGISPIAQQNLLNYFKEYDKDVSELIPGLPDVEDAAKIHYVRLISRLGTYLSGEHNGRAYPMAILVVNWMNGYPLARIIIENYRYWKKKKPETELSKVIRDTMSDIEKYVRFSFAKYSGCYTDILKFYLKTYHPDLADKVPELSMWVEFGVSQKTQISLINLGLSRHTAIELSEYIGNRDLSRNESAEWILKTDISVFEIPEAIKKEIRKVKEILTKSQEDAA